MERILVVLNNIVIYVCRLTFKSHLSSNRVDFEESFKIL